MIVGVGCDLCAVARMQTIVTKPSALHFLQRVFSPSELTLFGLDDWDTTCPPIPTKTVERLAANFAAKEAFLKATGKGLSGFALCELAALRNQEGAPYYQFTGGAAAYMAQNKYQCHLSLTHEKGAHAMAMAYCILEQS